MKRLLRISVLAVACLSASLATGCFSQTVDQGDLTDETSQGSHAGTAATGSGGAHTGSTPAQTLELRLHPSNDGEKPHPEPWLRQEKPHPEPWAELLQPDPNAGGSSKP
jgi:hypothetical protein